MCVGESFLSSLSIYKLIGMYNLFHNLQIAVPGWAYKSPECIYVFHVQTIQENVYIYIYKLFFFPVSFLLIKCEL